MSTLSFGRTLRVLGALLLVGAGSLGAQGTQGSISVRVTEAAGGRPLDQAQVVIVGTTLGGLTNAEGRFTFRNVNPGTVQVRVLRVGYAEQKKGVTVAAGQAAEVEFVLSEVALTLAPVVTTATGTQRRQEIGNATANVAVSDVVASAPVSSLNDVLNARAPGVQVAGGTQTGTGSRIRVRGMNSISLNNEPIWIIDGVRMTSNNGSFSTATGNGASANTGGNNASRVGDLNPEEIESIEIVKGPSAATLYGTDAANGVILVTTKRGRAGAAQWNVYAEGGLIEDRNDYPWAYTLFGTRTDGVSPTAPSFCNLQRVGTGLCRVDSIGALNIFKEKDLSPVDIGNRRQAGAQVSGGTEQIRYFVSAENEREEGVLSLPEFERQRFDSLNIPLRDWTDRPNLLNRNSLRVNLNSVVNSKLDLSAQTNFIDLRQRYSLESNSTAGLGSHVFGGPGYRGNGTVSGLGSPLNGYRAWTPGYMWQEKTEQTVSRFIWSTRADWRPTGWLQNRATVGQDFTMRSDENLLYRGEGPPLTANTRLGSRGVSRVNINNFTVDLGSTATFNPRDWLNLKTTAGAQYIDYRFSQSQSGGSQLAPGAQTVQSGAQPFVSEGTTMQKTFGLFVEQAVALRDRLFLTAAVRSDQNSAFGTEFQRVFYPKFSASWLVSDESFWRAPSFLNTMRFRFAYGQSGVQPGPNDALRFYTANTTNIATVDQPTVTFASLGNPSLKPERSAELETGFEAQMLNSRVTLDVTYYNKRTQDALIERIVPPSWGTVTRQLTNLGAVRNTGWEFQVNMLALDKRWLGWDLNISGSLNDNNVESLGDTPPQIGTASRIVKGYPIGGLWAPPITGWEDKNKDGILTYFADPTRNEVFVGDSAIFRGYSTPRYIATLISGWEVLNRRLRVQTLFDYRGGHKWYNDTERIRCQRPNCGGRNNPTSPFNLQAANIARLEMPIQTLDGYFQPGSFVRLREASVQYTFSPNLAARLLRASTASFVVSARNLAVWTNYPGTDPETAFNFTSGTDVPADFQTLAPTSYLVFRLNLGF
jgi:TonB-linked SusC/RagA family outer membrane protein